MSKLAVFVVVLSISPLAAAAVSVRVCLADGNTPLDLVDANTPFVYRNVMVGTKLMIIVSSDAPGAWSGGLLIEGIDRDYGVLSGRGYSASTHDWEGSRFAEAGRRARVRNAADSFTAGLNLNSEKNAVPGDWFMIDYTATQVGSCRVAFYDYPPLDDWPVGPNDPLPVAPDIVLAELVFNQVPTRDFNQDTRVGLGDFAILASYWGAMGCAEPDRCQGADLNADGFVDSRDLVLFADYWLEKTQ